MSSLCGHSNITSFVSVIITAVVREICHCNLNISRVGAIKCFSPIYVVSVYSYVIQNDHNNEL